MIKKRHIVLLFLIMGIGQLTAQTLKVCIENVEAGKGHLMVGVFNNENNFPNNYFRGEKIEAFSSIMFVTFSNLPLGQYAVSVYQDSNNNGQLDTGIFGIPKEKYGFSNGLRRPDFKKCLFDFNCDVDITVQIK